MELKRCTKCGEEKPLSEYHKNGKKGHGPHCRLCKNAALKEWRSKNREEYLQKLKAYRERTPEKCAASRKKYYANHRNELKEKKRAYNEKNRKRINARHADYMGRYKVERCDTYKNRILKKQHGIDLVWFKAQLARQEGKCGICGFLFDLNIVGSVAARAKKPHVDHDHKTGKIRGLLCTKCNAGLGQFRDTPAFLKAAIKYLMVN